MIDLDEDISLVGEIGAVGGVAADLLLNGGDIIVSSIIAPILLNFSLIASLIGQLDAVLGSSLSWIPLSTISTTMIYALLGLYSLRLYGKLT